MHKCRCGETGDTLVEIVIALVVIGIIVGAFFAAIATSSTSSKAQRDFVTADALLRDYAESTKTAVRRDCPTSPTFVTTTTSVPGFTVASDTNQCPVDVTQVQPVNLTVTLPNGSQKKLSIDVRTP